jgi:hypothetical protein
MEWTQQFEGMMKSWTDAQQKAWNGFFETVQGAGQSPSTKLWLQTLAVGEEMLKNTLKAQVDLLAAWVENLGTVPNVPAAALESAKQFQEMAGRWSMTQEQLFDNWFGMVRKLVPSLPGETAWTDAPQTTFKAWQATTQSIMEAQAEWTRAWMGAASKK